MRLLRIGIAGIAVVPFLLAARGAAAPRSQGRCAVPSTLVAPSLPATVSVTTRCGVYELARDGSVTRVSAASNPYPNGTEWWPDSDIWLRSVHQHLVVGRGKRTLWRSAGRFRHEYEVGTIAIRRQLLAFSYGSRVSHLYIARFGGAERRVGHGYPLGWTRGGLYVGRSGAVYLLHEHRERRLPGAAVDRAVYDAASRELYYVAHDRLFSASGARSTSLAALGPIGLAARARSLQVLLLGRLIGIETNERLGVLRADGSLVSSTRLLVRTRSSDFMSDEPVASPRSGDIAFAVMRPIHRIVEQRFERGIETVYLLRPGARAAVPILTREMKFNVCGHGATLAWHGAWLLYSVGEGPAALIDTRTGHSLGLTSVVRRLPGFSGVEENGPLSLAWS